MFKKHVYDLQETQKNYLEAGIKNTNLANETVAHMQTSILTIVLAELAFLGVMSAGRSFNWLSATCVTLLVLGLVFFLYATNLERAYVLRAARDFIQKSRDMQEYIKVHKKTMVKEIPPELLPAFNSVRTNKKANIFFTISYWLIFLASVIVIIIVWGKVS